MFKDEFEAMDPTKIPLEDSNAVHEAAVDDPYGDGLDPEERSFQRHPTPVPILKVEDSAKFSASQL